MKAYIEYVVFNNFAINLLIMIMVIKTLKLEKNYFRIITADIIATTMAVFYPYINSTYSILYKISIVLIVPLIFAKYKNIKIAIFTYILFLFYTFSLGGICSGICNLFEKYFYKTFVPNENAIIGLSIFSGLLLAYVIRQLSFYFNTKNISNINAEIICNKKTIKLNGFVDTGNKIYDNCNKPVIVLDKELQKEIENLVKPSGNIQIYTINSVENCDLYKIDKLKIKHNDFEKYYYNVNAILGNTGKDYKLIVSNEYI